MTHVYDDAAPAAIRDAGLVIDAIKRRTSDVDYSPLGDSRERSVPCSRCNRKTWRLSALCARCELDQYDEEDAYYRALDDRIEAQRELENFGP